MYSRMTGVDGASGIDWEKVGEVLYDGGDELMAMGEAYAAEREQFPVLTHDLRLNERGGLFRWLGILQIVSLERSEPFLADLGLAGFDPAVLRSVAREALDAIYPIEEDYDVGLEEFVAILEAALERLGSELGPQWAERFLAYCATEMPYYGAEERREDDWNQLFRKLVFGHDGRSPLVEPGLPVEALRAVRRAVRDHIDPHLDVRSDTADALPRSAWDEVVYARYDGWSPLDEVYAIVSYYQVLGAWRAIEAALSADELAALVEWGRRQAAVLPGMRPDEIAPPPTPRVPSA